MILIDTNVLVYTVNTAAPCHKESRLFVEAAQQKRIRGVLVPQVLLEAKTVLCGPDREPRGAAAARRRRPPSRWRSCALRFLCPTLLRRLYKNPRCSWHIDLARAVEVSSTSGSLPRGRPSASRRSARTTSWTSPGTKASLLALQKISCATLPLTPRTAAGRRELPAWWRRLPGVFFFRTHLLQWSKIEATRVFHGNQQGRITKLRAYHQEIRHSTANKERGSRKLSSLVVPGQRDAPCGCLRRGSVVSWVSRSACKGCPYRGTLLEGKAALDRDKDEDKAH